MENFEQKYNRALDMAKQCYSQVSETIPETCKEKDNSFTDNVEKAAMEKYPSKERVLMTAFGKLTFDALKTEREAFIAGAKWQQALFMKNSRTAFDTITEEEYDLETDFATGIIEKENRMPTFIDAIKYGMQKQREQMLKGAIKTKIVNDWTYGKDPDHAVIPAIHTRLGKQYKVKDKVKFVILKDNE